MKEEKLKKYDVTLDIFLMEHVYVEARNKKEAEEKAIENSRFVRAEGAEVKVFEIQEDN